MDSVGIIDMEMQIGFEDVRQACVAEFAKKDGGTDTLMKWGSGLLQCSQFGITLGVSRKLNKVEISPTNHDALWWLGSAHTALAYLTYDSDAARIHFEKALSCFQKANELCPGRHAYMRSLRTSAEMDHEWYRMVHENRGPYTGSAASSSAKALHEPESRNKSGGSAASSSAKALAVQRRRRIRRVI